MKLILAKNWGDHKKGDEVEIIDKTVIKAGKSQGLFVKAKKGDEEEIIDKTDKKEE